MTPIPITLTAEFVCPVCKEVVTAKPVLEAAEAYPLVEIYVACPHCGEEYEGEA